MKNYADKVKLKGVVKVDNWLSENDQEKISKTISILKPKKSDADSYFVVNLKTIVKKIFKLKFKSIITSIYYWNLSRKLNLKRIAEEILGSKVRLTRIDHYWSAKSEKPVIQWHVDNAYSGREDVEKFVKPDENAIKFFFFNKCIF